MKNLWSKKGPRVLAVVLGCLALTLALGALILINPSAPSPPW